MTRSTLRALFLAGLPAACSHDTAGAPTPASSSSTTSDDTDSTGPPPTTGGDAPTSTTGTTLPDDSTTGLPDGTTGGDVTSPAEPFCGDGVIEGEEECDEGVLSNKDTGTCTMGCQKARCGDGFVQPDLGETCDDGELNAIDPNYGQCRAVTCTRGPHCGDGIVQTEDGEECEPNPVRGEEETCASSCLAKTRALFLSSVTRSGDLGGPYGADALCNQLAAAGALPGTYRAWLLVAGKTLAERFHELTAPGSDYKFVSTAGAPLAKNFAELVAYGPAYAPYFDEYGLPHPKVWVWTGITAGGQAGADCGQWKSTADVGLVGYSGFAMDGPENEQWHDERWWTEWPGPATPCNQVDRHIYCLQVTD